jgi:hypothetical protein
MLSLIFLIFLIFLIAIPTFLPSVADSRPAAACNPAQRPSRANCTKTGAQSGLHAYTGN